MSDTNEDEMDSKPSSPSETRKMLPGIAPPPSHSWSLPALHIPEQPDQTLLERKLDVILALIKDFDGKLARYNTAENMTASQRWEMEQGLEELKGLDAPFHHFLNTFPDEFMKTRYSKCVKKFYRRFNAAIYRNQSQLNPLTPMKLSDDEDESLEVDLPFTPPGNQVDLRPFNQFSGRIETFKERIGHGVPFDKIKTRTEIETMRLDYLSLLVDSADVRSIEMTKKIRANIYELLRAL